MKRKNKLILVVVIAALYIVISLNFNKIKFTMSMINLYTQEKKTEDIAEDNSVNENVVLHNPLESIINDGNYEDNEDNEIESPNVIGDEKSPTTPTISNPEKDSKKSYKSIVNDYNTKFESLQSSFEADLNDLLAQGAAEYSSGNLSSTQLAAKYMSSGANMEKASDVKFKAVLKDMEKELKKNGHDTAIIQEIQSYYTNFKDSKKLVLINKGLDYIN